MSTRFIDVAREAFSFLENAGFDLVQHDSARLQYETDQSVVAVEWDVRSGEMDVSIGLQPKNGEQKEMFSLTDILDMQSVNVPERKMPFQVADESRLGPFVKKLAEDTRIHAQPALSGDRMFFRRLEVFRGVQAQAYMHAMQLRHVRSEAEKAWHKREFDKLISLYASIEKELSESEKRKLNYARKHAGN